ncbi:MAG: DUF3996 domain-containing protein [Spirochaetaceae bacterium]|jgi:hypothetical protein|nr:DUF3996 domain-containing protein [Spirochaetaceae bacterium]
MKKVILTGILFLFLAAGFVYADHPDGFGIGVQGGISGAAGVGDYGGDLTLKLPDVDIFWTVGAALYPGYFGVTVAGDWYFVDAVIIDSWLNGYVGVGAGAHIGLGDTLGLAAAARLPLGLSFQPVELLEIYLQIVPQIGLSILPGVGLWGNFWSGNLGVRLWF